MIGIANIALTEVSIHAPTQGATRCNRGNRRCNRGFNPRAHAGRDLYAQYGSCGYVGFNPRAHAGRDRLQPQETQPNAVSIHAPTQGATQALGCIKDNIFVSIHAPTQGATWMLRHSDCVIVRFNPRAHAGRDLSRCHAFQSMSRFNPRAHAGRDEPLQAMVRCHFGFNPRAHAGRDFLRPSELSGGP